MKDKLSLEELILDLNDAFAMAIEAVARQDTKDRIDQALKQIKAMLQPVPEAKRNEFAAHWWRILKDYQSGKMAGQLTNLIKAMLEEYDTLKESADEK